MRKHTFAETDKSGTASQKRDKWVSRENCDFFRDTSLKIRIVPEILGRMVTLSK